MHFKEDKCNIFPFSSIDTNPYKTSFYAYHCDTLLGTEELAHVELVSAILYQLTKNMTIEQVKNDGFDTYFVDHTAGVYAQAASGTPFSTSTLQVTGDTIADLTENLAADGTFLSEQLTRQNVL